MNVSFAVTPDPTPEPATWAILLLGAFGLGGALRQRRAGRPVAA
jgi:hypothetical protein